MAFRRIPTSIVNVKRTISFTFITLRSRPPVIPASRHLSSTHLKTHGFSENGATSREMSTLGEHSIYADGALPPVAIKRISSSGIELVDGLVLSSACIFLEGRVFLWEVPPLRNTTSWSGWSTNHFKIFEVVVPKPEILLLGTGNAATMPPLEIKKYLNNLGIQLDVMNTRNACSTYNLLAEEGRRVATALLPTSSSHTSWHSSPSSSASSPSS